VAGARYIRGTGVTGFVYNPCLDSQTHVVIRGYDMESVVIYGNSLGDLYKSLMQARDANSRDKQAYPFLSTVDDIQYVVTPVTRTPNPTPDDMPATNTNPSTPVDLPGQQLIPGVLVAVAGSIVSGKPPEPVTPQCKVCGCNSFSGNVCSSCGNPL